MRKAGTIVRWDEAKGFGFIRSDSVSQDVFVHVRDCRWGAGQVVRQGLRVTFDEVHVGGKGPRAVAVMPAGQVSEGRRDSPAGGSPGHSKRMPARGPRTASHPKAWLILPLMMAYTMGLVWLVWQRHFPWWVLLVSFLLNLVTFYVYWQDKYAAQQRRWRVKEDTLHFFSLAGGWGGAWLAQRVLRHKSVKAAFRSTWWLTVFVHCAAVFGAWWFLFR